MSSPSAAVPAPTGTVTFLFTDIEGSTALWEAQPDAMRLALARHDRLLQQIIHDAGGVVFKTLGDGFCAAFAVASDAVSAALAIQTGLIGQAGEPDIPLRVRVAVHTGAAEYRNDDYFGPPLNRVARLLAAGWGGQVLLSASTHELIRDNPPPASGLLDLGQHGLKDLARPEHIYQLIHPDLPAEFAPLRSRENLPNNLAQPLTSFVGREGEIADIKQLLTGTRFLTLTGAGGCGKSRLALHVAADLLDGEGDGVWVVELAPVSDPALVGQTVAQVFDVREEADRPLLQTLTDFLRSRRLLLLLDNCEHLLTECAALADTLLRACPHLTLLASSREALGIAGETVYRVPSLALPDGKGPQTVESISRCEAVRLFVERAGAVAPAFAVTRQNAPAVAQVCRRLDGIPLAVELAAARIRSLSVEEINARLDNRFRLLTGGSRTALPRQQTLRALIDWSYDLLTAPEQILLMRLSVFAGGWTLLAAEQICADEGNGALDGGEVLDYLTGLVDKSLVSAETSGDATRYRLLETVRQYARDRLRETGTDGHIRDRHAAFFLRFMEEARQHLSGGDQTLWFARVDADYDNIRAALDCLEGEERLSLAGSLAWYWNIRGLWNEADFWLGKSLDDPALGGKRTLERARALHGRAVVNTVAERGDRATIEAWYSEALAIRREGNDSGGEAATLVNLGSLARERAEFALARTLYTEALHAARRSHLFAIEGTSAFNLGYVAFYQGDFQEAQAVFDRLLPLARANGHKTLEAETLAMRGKVAEAGGDLAGACRWYEEAAALYREFGFIAEINSHLSLADARGRQGDFARAHAQIEQARALVAASGFPVKWLLVSAGNLALREGDAPAADRAYRDAARSGDLLQNPVAVPDILEGLAALAALQTRYEAAAGFDACALARREAIGVPGWPVDNPRREARTTLLRAALGQAAYDSAAPEGRALAPADALARFLAS